MGTGGVGFLTRDFGYACDQLVEVQYVLADGRVVVANAGNQYADLYRATKGAGGAGLGVMTRLTVRVVPAVTVLFYVVAFEMKDGAAVLEAWQNLAATAPDALSSISAGTASTDGTGALVFNGEFRVEHGDVQAARNELLSVLQTRWLDLLPPPLNQTPILIQELTTLEAANTVAALVPMPLFNQWKLKSRFNYVNAFWSSPTHDFVPFLIGVKQKYDPTDVFKGAQTIPLAL